MKDCYGSQWWQYSNVFSILAVNAGVVLILTAFVVTLILLLDKKRRLK